MASIKQYRGKTWRAIVRRKGFVTQSKTFALKRDAETWAARIEANMGVSECDPLQQKQAKAKVLSLFERYEVEVAVKMKGRNAAATIRRLMKADLMNIGLDKITPRDIRDWRDSRVKEVQPQTVHRELNSMSAVFTHAIKEWSAPIQNNPCHSVSRFKNADKPRDKRWTDGDIQKFLIAAEWSADKPLLTGRDYTGWALLIAVETAMRTAEMCMPLVSDFHPEEKYVHLRDTKNGDKRNVPLSIKGMSYLDRLCKGKKPTDKIIPLGPDALGEYMHDVRAKAGLLHLVTHDARHEAATRMSSKLSNVLELAAVTGHRSLKSLKRYYNPTPSELAGKLG